MPSLLPADSVIVFVQFNFLASPDSGPATNQYSPLTSHFSTNPHRA
jgi:hypothetical protein